jgi:hypothetical protein
MDINTNPTCFVAFSDGSSTVADLDKAKIIIANKEAEGVTVKTLQPVM